MTSGSRGSTICLLARGFRVLSIIAIHNSHLEVRLSDYFLSTGHAYCVVTDRNKAAALRRLSSTRQYSYRCCRSPESSISSPSPLPSEPESHDVPNTTESALYIDAAAFVTSTKARQRGSVSLLTPQVTAALDRANISDRKAAQLLAAIASTGHFHTGTEKLVISRSAIRRARMANRTLSPKKQRTNFRTTCLWCFTGMEKYLKTRPLCILITWTEWLSSYLVKALRSCYAYQGFIRVLH